MPAAPRPTPRGARSRSARPLQRELRAAARPTAGFDARAHLGSPVPVLEVRSPDVRGIARAFHRGHRNLPLAGLHRLAGQLWQGRTFEERILGIELLRCRLRSLDESSWEMLDRWVDDVSGWGLTDSLAGGLLSEMVPGHAARYRDLDR
jgi:hypothetical protein